MNHAKRVKARNLLKAKMDYIDRRRASGERVSLLSSPHGVSTIVVTTPTARHSSFTHSWIVPKETCSVCGDATHYADVCPSRNLVGTPTPACVGDEDEEAQEVISGIIESARREFSAASHRFGGLDNLIAARVLQNIQASKIPDVSWGPVRDHIIKSMEARFEDDEVWRQVRKWTGHDAGVSEIARLREFLKMYEELHADFARIRAVVNRQDKTGAP